MKYYKYLYLFLLLPLLIHTADDFLNNCVIVQSNKPAIIARPLTYEQRFSFAEQHDSDYKSLKMFYDFLCFVSTINNGKLNGENLVNTRKYWNCVSDHLLKKLKNEISLCERIENIRESLNINFQSRITKYVRNDCEIKVIVKTFDAYERPFNICAFNAPLKIAISDIIKKIAENYNDFNEKNLLNLVNLFPSNVNTYIEKPLICEIPVKIIEKNLLVFQKNGYQPTCESTSTLLNINNSRHSNRESPINSLQASLLLFSEISVSSESESFSQKTFINKLEDSYIFSTPPKPRFITGLVAPFTISGNNDTTIAES